MSCTKGPWEKMINIGVYGDYSSIHAKHQGRNVTVCSNIYNLPDARLIVAAPEMFEALEAWETALKSEGLMVPYFLQAALKKARGE